MPQNGITIGSLCVILLELCFIAMTFGKDSEFTVAVEAGQRACFFAANIQKDANFEVEYQVIEGGDLDVNFILQSPSGSVLLSELKKSDNVHKITAKESGDYQICFDNSFSRFTRKLVFFEVVTDEEDPTQDWSKVAAAETEIDIKLEDFRMTMDKVKRNLEKTQQTQKVLAVLESKDRSVMEQNYDRVNTWSVVQLAIMITVSISQIVLIRSLFDDKSKVRKIFQMAERT
ncbi:transmembrane emp24 domain-containing protein 1-like [Lineus longissimus]|uniref:transmembrane emp24 domain-containing protein 1-like n=1 Tax=Lineus longissimus TaxID=88925 RepID=UPI002B4E9BE0